MQVNIDLPYDLETLLREQAKRKGKALNQYIVSLIKEKVDTSKPMASALSSDESRLFNIINKGFSDDFWSNLNKLNKKRQLNTLTEPERQELITLSEALETINVERMKALIELATLRQTDLDSLMTNLGLNNGKHH